MPPSRSSRGWFLASCFCLGYILKFYHKPRAHFHPQEKVDIPGFKQYFFTLKYLLQFVLVRLGHKVRDFSSHGNLSPLPSHWYPERCCLSCGGCLEVSPRLCFHLGAGQCDQILQVPKSVLQKHSNVFLSHRCLKDDAGEVAFVKHLTIFGK